MAIDVIYVIRRVIERIYLLDAVAEVVLGKAEERRRPSSGAGRRATTTQPGAAYRAAETYLS